MKLLGSPGSPYVRKVRIVLAEKRINYEFIIDRPSNPDSRVAQYNPLGKIPVLVRDDGRTVYDSVVIVEYLEGLVPEPRLIPASFEDRIEVKRWEALGDGIADATVLVSHDLRETEAQRKPAAWYAKQRQKIQRGLAAMERDLGTRDFCHGGSFSLADIAAGFALGYLDHVLSDTDWRAEHPALKKRFERLAVRESFVVSKPAV
ncbi:MAG: glutathione S-transferase [Betaproteobacteria bacterium]|nr:glutathione S-transferase [Betaproteobacteria bacterium]